MAECDGSQQVRRVEERDPVVGSAPPGAVRDDAGRNRIQGGESATQTLTAGEVVQALQRRHRSRSQDGRMRGRQRHAWHVRLHMTIQECSKESPHRRDVEIETCDLSASGFAFVSLQFLHLGTLVYPRFVTLPNRPVLKGVVRNCTLIEGRRHRVGVEFLQMVPGEVVPNT